MKRPSFFEGVGLALLFAGAGSVLFTLLAPWFGAALLLRGLCSASALAYVLYLVARSRLRSGRVTLFVAWTVVAAVIAVLSPSLLIMVVAHLVVMWLLRAVLFHTSLLTALADLALSGLALAAACWALLATGSVFVTLWSLWLVQAAFALLPAHLGDQRRSRQHDHDRAQRFKRAARSAEQALRTLSSQP